MTNKQQVSESSEPGGLAPTVSTAEEKAGNEPNGDIQEGAFPALMQEEEELVEKEIRERFKKMCDGYYDSVSKKLVIEHKVRIFELCGLLGRINLFGFHSACKNKIVVIMKHTFDLEKYLRIVSRRMKR